MRKLLVIGIGAGNPDHLTRQGAQAIQEADTILVPRKGAKKDDLAQIRRDICAELGVAERLVEFDLPVRASEGEYRQRVDDWHDAIARAWTEALPEGAGVVALLVWGDPSLYDSTLRIAERLDPKPRIKVIPGVSALQALTAAHGITLNAINAPVTITTGRRLRDEGWPLGAETVAVMLDGECSFRHLDPDGLTIWWGAFLGMENEVLCSGPLDQVAEQIVEVRQEARDKHGWIMDIYLLKASGT